MMQIPIIGSRVIFLDRCDSTNAELARISGLPDTINGTVVLTYEQTAGRGRRGNSWSSTPNKDLTFSFLITKPAIRAENAFLPVAAAAVACAEYLREQLPEKRVEIKWPNDILCGGRKISGMLVENTFSGNESLRTVVGIGINLNGDRYGDTRFPATSFFLETGREKIITDALAELLTHLNRSFTQLYGAPALLINRYNTLLYGKTEHVPLTVAQETVWGKLLHVDAFGNPQIETKNGQPVAARADEIQFLPAV